VLLGVRHSLEVLSGYSSEAVMPGKTVVHKSVIGRVKVEDIPVLTHDAVEKEFGFFEHRVCELLMEVRVDPNIRMDRFQVLES